MLSGTICTHAQCLSTYCPNNFCVCRSERNTNGRGSTTNSIQDKIHKRQDIMFFVQSTDEMIHLNGYKHCLTRHNFIWISRKVFMSFSEYYPPLLFTRQSSKWILFSDWRNSSVWWADSPGLILLALETASTDWLDLIRSFLLQICCISY